MQTILIISALILAALLLRRRHAGRLATPAAVAALLKQQAKIIDVRTPDEYRNGHVPGAHNLPLAELGRHIGRLAPDKNQPLLLHCAGGARSAAGQQVLKRLGYASVHNLGSYPRARALLDRPD